MVGLVNFRSVKSPTGMLKAKRPKAEEAREARTNLFFKGNQCQKEY
jgi:hypothetical protein